MTFSALLAHWQNDPLTAPNISTWNTLPARLAVYRPLPADLPRQLSAALLRRGIGQLYSHQAEAWEAARRGENFVIATGTASGKTLSYNLPVAAALTESPSARALYLFPTKALTQDQLAGLKNLLPADSSLAAAIYDGDTPQSQRSAIRKGARILLSNPDMLHTGILPHHTNWAEFFRNLRFVVIDEMHTYRGVFGSHVANVLRRLKRIAAFYGAQPQFILTSATIGNPAELAERLIEAPVTLIDRDGSARGERHFLIYNPPVVNEDLGLRKSATLEAVRLAQDLLATHVQTVVFARTRRNVEILLTYLQPSPAESDGLVRGYRSGYLPTQRREIETGLRDGSVQVVVATNALELGIDIGGLGAALLVGYPGSVASVYQQAGRAGRGEAPAAAVLVATANPLDQFLAHHPEYFFGRSPERGLIDPDHLLILLNHLRCAIFELPFSKGETFGGQPVDEFIEFLISGSEAHASLDKYYWMADAYPAASVSLRSASPENVIIQTTAEGSEGRPRTVGEVDLHSAFWMVHPQAIYMHEGQQYFVHDLNLRTNTALVTAVAMDYYTEAVRETQVEVLSETARAQAAGAEKAWGELKVTTQVTGFKKLRWFTRENLGQEPLDLPPTELQTTGYWLSVSEATVAALGRDGLWTNAPNDYGSQWPKIRERVRARDGFCCQVCGRPENGRQHDVHHKTPFRFFMREAAGDPAHVEAQRERANRLDNLVTLCPECHRKTEANVRARSGMAGLGYVLSNLAPLFLMCDAEDLGLHLETESSASFPQPAVVLFDQVPAGIGFSEKLFEMHADLLARALELVSACACADGCPSCTGPGGENGTGGKNETLALLRMLTSGS